MPVVCMINTIGHVIHTPVGYSAFLGRPIQMPPPPPPTTRMQTKQNRQLPFYAYFRSPLLGQPVTLRLLSAYNSL